MNNDIYKKGIALLEAAQDYWQACYDSGGTGAVKYLTDEHGRMVVFTRGEYRYELFKNIFSMKELGTIKYFSGEDVEELERNKNDK